MFHCRVEHDAVNGEEALDTTREGIEPLHVRLRHLLHWSEMVLLLLPLIAVYYHPCFHPCPSKTKLGFEHTAFSKVLAILGCKPFQCAES